MKELYQKTNCFKNNHYVFKVQPLECEQWEHLDQSDIENFNNRDAPNYSLKLKIDPDYYTFFIKSDKSFNDQIILDIEDYVMTVMQLSTPNESIEGFSHSFAIPEFINLDNIKLYSKGNALLILIERV
jgi:hypothetical protein